MSARLTKSLELLVGRWQPSIATAVARFALGIMLPAVILFYGISCGLSRHATVITRGGLAEIIGLPAVAVGIAYAAIGMILYVHICWDAHPYFAGLRDVARQFLLLVMIVALAATLGLALI